EDEVTWTINRRITTGFALAALLVVAIALTGIWALRQTAGTFTNAVSAERTVLLRAIEARRHLANANVAYLRTLVQEVGVSPQERADGVALTRALLMELRAAAAGDQTQVWTEAMALLDRWDDATERVVALWDAG